MSAKTSSVIVAIGALALCGPAHAWGPDGHRIVCAIAWEEMTPAAQARVREILQVDTREAFAETCNWADAYTAEHRETIPWHFVNVPPNAAAVDMSRDCANGTCVLARIAAETDALRHGASDASEHLRFLMHFVGDVHQPLHASFAADRGGNDFKGLYFSVPTNLHMVWDIGLLEHDGRPWPEIAPALRASITPEARIDLVRTKPLDWANESLAISRAPPTGYLPHGDTFELDAEYTRVNLPVALTRLKQAGVRLGALLNDIFHAQP